MDQDAHNAVVAMILGRSGTFGVFHANARHIFERGYPLRINDRDEIEWWPSSKQSYNWRHTYRALERIADIELDWNDDRSGFIVVVGPLGLAALRAELNLKYPQQ